jgi:hypothetical protein
MPLTYEVKVKRLPLPRGPLAEGHSSPGIMISAKPDIYHSEADTLRRARTRVQEGCEISILLSDGREWTNEEVLRRLNSTG